MATQKKKEKILVTGGAGFIGSHVAESYIKMGYEVVIIDNLSNGSRKNIPPGALFYEADISDPKKMEAIFKKESPTLVNHHASQIDVRLSLENPAHDADTNILGTLNLLEASRKEGVKKFIYASSGGAVYGETPAEGAKESDPTHPSSHYAVSKLAAEYYIRLYAHLYGLDFTILRYANVYGPRQNPLGEAGVIAIFIHRLLTGETPIIYGDGNQVRDYVYVEEVALANVQALKLGSKATLNIGTQTPTTVNQLYTLLQKELNNSKTAQHHPKREGEIGHSLLHVALAKKTLQWKPHISIKEGLNKTIFVLDNTRAS